MRKLFSFFTAMLVALAVNAATINIDNSTPDALRTALNSAADGDEIVMAAGTYVESNSNYIAFDGKAVTVKAAEDANVIIQPQVPITVSNGGHAIFENVKIDASRLTELADWYEHLFYVTDGNPNGYTFRGCELYGFNLNSSMFYCNNVNKVAAMKFENCYLHDIQKSIIFIENPEGKPMVSVKNCTFENIIATVTNSYWAGIIDVRAAEATLQVDHCTFYNVIPMNTDYSCVSKITLAKGTVKNCIFMLPTAQDNIRAMRGVTATNCITFNYLKDDGTGIHSSVTQTNCVQVDPAFLDPDNGNFTLSATSPALTMNDGQPIGDPRWVPAAAPEPTYTVAGEFQLVRVHWDPTATENDMIKQEDGTYKLVKENVTLYNGDYEYKVAIDHKWENGEASENSVLAIGPDYRAIYNITFTYKPATGETNAVAELVKVEPPLVYIYGEWNKDGDNWNANEVIIADDMLSCSYEVELAAGTYEFYVYADSNNQYKDYVIKRDYNTIDELQPWAYVEKNIQLNADVAGKYTFTWTYATQTLVVTYPAFRLKDGFYLVGKFGGVEAWNAKELNADKLFYPNPKKITEMMLENVTLTEGDELKVVWVSSDAIQDWFPGSEAPNYIVDANHAGTKTIYFNAGGNGDTNYWHYGYIYIDANDPTGMENTRTEMKSAKFIENGQLYLMYQGTKYNVQGAIVR